MLFPNFLDIFADGSHSLIRVVVCEPEKTLHGDGDRFHQHWSLFSETTISHPFAITSVISFYTKKWYHFHSNEVRRRVAQHYHLPIDDYANSHTVHWCNKRKKKRAEKTVIRASRVFTTAGEWLWVSLESGFCESAQPNEILHHHMAGLWATQWQQHLLSQLVFTLSIFRANGPSQGWSLTCNSPLM